MNQRDYHRREIYNQGAGNRSPITRKSLSFIPKSEIDFGQTIQSLTQKYDKETEAIDLKKDKKRFYVPIYALCVLILAVSATRIPRNRR